MTGSNGAGDTLAGAGGGGVAMASQVAGNGVVSADAIGGAGLGVVMRIPVSIEIVLGTAQMPLAKLMKLARGSIISLDRKIGEPVDVVVNNRVVARGEVVVLDEEQSRFGVSLTEVASIALEDLDD
ncbi:MAG: flagellar motor switch protein FliN [Pseudomonadota bacterium]